MSSKLKSVRTNLYKNLAWKNLDFKNFEEIQLVGIFLRTTSTILHTFSARTLLESSCPNHLQGRIWDKLIAMPLFLISKRCGSQWFCVTNHNVSMRSGDYSRQLWYLHRCGLHCYLARSRLFKRCSFFWGLYWPLTPRDDLTLVLTYFFPRCTRWKAALWPSSKALTPTTPISWWARCLNLLSPLGVGPRLLWFPRSNNYQHQPQASGLNDSYISTWSYQERWKRRARCLSSCKTHQKFNKK